MIIQVTFGMQTKSYGIRLDNARLDKRVRQNRTGQNKCFVLCLVQLELDRTKVESSPKKSFDDFKYHKMVTVKTKE